MQTTPFAIPLSRCPTRYKLRPWRTSPLPSRAQLPRRRSPSLCPGSAPCTNGNRYDRQLRLWGATGQAALESSHILLINSGPGVVGVETLKNLVLPCIGDFTIQDPAVVTEADLGVNFFLEDQHLRGFRAEHTCNLLKELNPDVNGHFVTEVRALLASSLTLANQTSLLSHGYHNQTLCDPTPSSLRPRPSAQTSSPKSLIMQALRSFHYFISIQSASTPTSPSTCLPHSPL